MWLPRWVSQCTSKCCACPPRLIPSSQFAFTSQLASRLAQVGFSRVRAAKAFCPWLPFVWPLENLDPSIMWLPIAHCDLWHGRHICSCPASGSLSPISMAFLVFASFSFHRPVDFAYTHSSPRDAHSPG